MNFDNEALNWDTDKRINRAKIIADEIIKAIDIHENCNAMEFGCGTGLVSFNLCEKFNHITLVDSSSGMIDILNQKIRNSEIKNMTAFKLDITKKDEELPDKLDIIYTSMALHHIIDIETALRSLYKLLNNEGYLCIIELAEDDGSFHKSDKEFKGHNGFNPDKLKEILEKIGFNHVTANTFYNDYKIVEDSKIDYSLFILVGRK